MANAYTPGYHLNQWGVADSFLREEFNNDNRILDETLGLAGLDRCLERQVKPLGLEVYNLMLQHYYEGKRLSTVRPWPLHGSGQQLSRVRYPGAYHDASQKQIRILPDVPNSSTGFGVEVGYNDGGREDFKVLPVGWTNTQTDTERQVLCPLDLAHCSRSRCALPAAAAPPTVKIFRCRWRSSGGGVLGNERHTGDSQYGGGRADLSVFRSAAPALPEL